MAWPALLIVVLRYRPSWLLSVIAALGLASFALAEAFMAANPEAAPRRAGDGRGLHLSGWTLPWHRRSSGCGAALIILAVYSGETNAFLHSRSMAAAHPNVEIVDPTDHFCTAIICPPVKGGVALYWDTHHVSSTAARGFVLPTRRVAGQP